MRTKLLFAMPIITVLFTGCMGGSSDGEGTDSTTVSILGSWTLKSALIGCAQEPVEVEVIQSFEDRDNNGYIDFWTRYSGMLHDSDNCVAVPNSTETYNLSTLNIPARIANKTEFKKVVEDAYPQMFGYDSLSVNVITFTQQEIYYEMDVIDNNASFKVTDRWVK